jgi:hypothetical protein
LCSPNYRLVSNCAKVPVIAPQVACESCRAKQRKAHKTLSRQHEEAGLCNRCGQRPPLVGGKLCEDCNAHWRKLYSTHSGYKPARKVRRQTLKRTVMEAYGDARCACCGETEMAFLTIDHITGQGRHHRQVIDRRGGNFLSLVKIAPFSLWLSRALHELQLLSRSLWLLSSSNGTFERCLKRPLRKRQKLG